MSLVGNLVSGKAVRLGASPAAKPRARRSPPHWGGAAAVTGLAAGSGSARRLPVPRPAPPVSVLADGPSAALVCGPLCPPRLRSFRGLLRRPCTPVPLRVTGGSALRRFHHWPSGGSRGGPPPPPG